MPRVLAIAASARRGGNSDTLLERALDGLRDVEPRVEVETIIPHGLAVTPCRGCNRCRETGACVIEDGMRDVYPKFDACDHLVVAAPIYFTSVPGHLKVLVDRFQCYWSRKALLGHRRPDRRTGMFLCIAAMNRQRYYEASLTVVKSWMMVLDMTCTVSRFYTGLDRRDAALSREDYLQDAFAAGRELMLRARDEAPPG